MSVMLLAAIALALIVAAAGATTALEGVMAGLVVGIGLCHVFELGDALLQVHRGWGAPC